MVVTCLQLNWALDSPAIRQAIALYVIGILAVIATHIEA
jgi:hypothetical protein